RNWWHRSVSPSGPATAGCAIRATWACARTRHPPTWFGRRQMRTDELTIDEHRIPLPRPDKTLYPADGITKRDVVDYYREVAEVMLPHLRGRPLTLRRFPDGIEKDGFFQKEASDHFPDWLPIAEVP